jgi:alanyl-tRNA synthetase
LGYSKDVAQGIITALVKDGVKVESLARGDKGFVITNQTPFYAESGGQVGDSGSLSTANASAVVTDTQKPLDGIHAHAVTVEHGTLSVGDAAELRIDTTRRNRIRANHSATHILHAALRKHLGEHVSQKGSLVADDKLRFDVTHPKQITRDELDAIEHEVNRIIWQNSDVGTKLMTPDEAIAAGAMALFGEKYGDEVRVLSMGTDTTSAYSVELCGGTHVHRMGDIGLFKIVSEGAVSAGIRRIEAITQTGAFGYLAQQESTMRELALSMKIKQEDVFDKVLSLVEEKRKLEKQLADSKKQLALGSASGSGDIVPEQLGSLEFIGKSYPDLDPKALRDLAASLQQKHTGAVIALASGYEGKASIIIAVGKSIAGTVDAPTLVRMAAEIVGGKGGGGKSDMAQAGGSEAGAIDQAIAAIRSEIARSMAA